MRVPLRVGLPWFIVCLATAGGDAAPSGYTPGHEGSSPPHSTREPAGGLQDRESVQRVAFAELLEAMRAEQGYDARKTTNLARFQAGVLPAPRRAGTGPPTPGPAALLRPRRVVSGLPRRPWA